MLDREQQDILLGALPADIRASLDETARLEGDDWTKADAASIIAAVGQILSDLDNADPTVLSRREVFGAPQADRESLLQSMDAVNRARNYLDLASENRETAYKRSLEFASAVRTARLDREAAELPAYIKQAEEVRKTGEQAKKRLAELERQKSSLLKELENTRGTEKELTTKLRLDGAEMLIPQLQLQVVLGERAAQNAGLMKTLSGFEDDSTNFIHRMWSEISSQYKADQLKLERRAWVREKTIQLRAIAYFVVWGIATVLVDQVVASTIIAGLITSVVLALGLGLVDRYLISPRLQLMDARGQLRGLKAQVTTYGIILVRIRDLEGLMRALGRRENVISVELLDRGLFAE